MKSKYKADKTYSPHRPTNKRKRTTKKKAPKQKPMTRDELTQKLMNLLHQVQELKKVYE